MAQLVVRDLPDEVVEQLKAQAKRHGRSAEAEHREILKRALLRAQYGSFKEALLAMPSVGDDTTFAVRRGKARKVRL